MKMTLVTKRYDVFEQAQGYNTPFRGETDVDVTPIRLAGHTTVALE